MAEKHVTGPIQVFVIGFDKFEATGRIMAELRRARKRGVIRLVDVIFVQVDIADIIGTPIRACKLSTSTSALVSEMDVNAMGRTSSTVHRSYMERSHFMDTSVSAWTFRINERRVV